MLVLSRKPGERVVIAGSIVVTVVSVAGGRVRLGIEAPLEVRVLREEIADPAARPGRPPRASANPAGSAR
jgi:carbon storage regulator